MCCCKCLLFYIELYYICYYPFFLFFFICLFCSMGQTSFVIFLIMDSLARIKFYLLGQYLIIEGFQPIKGSVSHQVFKSLNLNETFLASTNFPTQT